MIFILIVNLVAIFALMLILVMLLRKSRLNNSDPTWINSNHSSEEPKSVKVLRSDHQAVPPQSTIPLRMEFVEQLILRSLNLDRNPESEIDQDTQMSGRGDQENVLPWDDPKVLRQHPTLTEVMEREIEEARQSLLFTQSQAMNPDQYQDEKTIQIMNNIYDLDENSNDGES